ETDVVRGHARTGGFTDIANDEAQRFTAIKVKRRRRIVADGDEQTAQAEDGRCGGDGNAERGCGGVADQRAATNVADQVGVGWIRAKVRLCGFNPGFLIVLLKTALKRRGFRTTSKLMTAVRFRSPAPDLSTVLQMGDVYCMTSRRRTFIWSAASALRRSVAQW